MKLGIVKETRDGEQRVAASADTVKRYVGLGLEVLVQKGAGISAGIGDEAYEKAGAKLVTAAGAMGAEILLKVQRPTDAEMAKLKQGQLLIGALDPYPNREQVQGYAEKGITAFSMELLPRTTRAQAMDILSLASQSRRLQGRDRCHGRL